MQKEIEREREREQSFLMANLIRLERQTQALVILNQRMQSK